MSAPVLFKSEHLKSQVRFIQFPADNNIALFYDDFLQIILVGDQTIRTKANIKYKTNGKNLEIFLVPPAFEQVINIFFL